MKKGNAGPPKIQKLKMYNATKKSVQTQSMQMYLSIQKYES